MQLFYWIKESKSKPPMRKGSDWDSVEVLVSLENGEVQLDTYSYHYAQWIFYGKKVTHWGLKPNIADGENE